jgi:hypothetical protein
MGKRRPKINRKTHKLEIRLLKTMLAKEEFRLWRKDYDKFLLLVSKEENEAGIIIERRHRRGKTQAQV